MNPHQMIQNDLQTRSLQISSEVETMLRRETRALEHDYGALAARLQVRLFNVPGAHPDQPNRCCMLTIHQPGIGPLIASAISHDLRIALRIAFANLRDMMARRNDDGSAPARIGLAIH